MHLARGWGLGRGTEGTCSRAILAGRMSGCRRGRVWGHPRAGNGASAGLDSDCGASAGGEFGGRGPSRGGLGAGRSRGEKVVYGQDRLEFMWVFWKLEKSMLIPQLN